MTLSKNLTILEFRVGQRFVGFALADKPDRMFLVSTRVKALRTMADPLGQLVAGCLDSLTGSDERTLAEIAVVLSWAEAGSDLGSASAWAQSLWTEGLSKLSGRARLSSVAFFFRWKVGNVTDYLDTLIAYGKPRDETILLADHFTAKTDLLAQYVQKAPAWSSYLMSFSTGRPKTQLGLDWLLRETSASGEQHRVRVLEKLAAMFKRPDLKPRYHFETGKLIFENRDAVLEALRLNPPTLDPP